MATLQEVVARVPSIGKQIDAMNELFPGVPADRGEALQALFEGFRSSVFGFNATLAHPLEAVEVAICPRRPSAEDKDTVIVAKVIVEEEGGSPTMALATFPCDPEGYHRALLFVKDVIALWVEHGPCPDCPSAPRLRDPRLGKCWGCTSNCVSQLDALVARKRKRSEEEAAAP